MKSKFTSTRFLSIVISMVLVMALLISAGCFSACSGNEEEPVVEDATVQSITLDTTNVQTVFSYGEEFTYEGLVVTANMSDGTTEEVPLSDCTVSTPDTMSPGLRNVNVTYSGKTARYTVTVNERIMATISSTSLVDITGASPEAVFRVEAEDIDFEISQTEASSGSIIVEDASVSSGKYAANLGVIGNYFGFTFTAEYDYSNVTIVFGIANQSTETILSLEENLLIYLNYTSTSNTGEIDIAGTTTLAKASVTEGSDGATSTEYYWTTRGLRNIDIPQGTNTLTFEVIGENVPMIDYIDFYVDVTYSGDSIVEITDESTEYTMEFEDFNLEKIVNRTDFVNAYGLKQGEVYIESASTNIDGTSGGTSACGFTTGTEISTTISVGADSTIEIIIVAANVDAYYVCNNWEFYIDGYKLTGVESKNIQGGDATQSLYWEWSDTSLGAYNLSEGDHLFEAKVTGTYCNVDIFRFNVLSYGSYDENGITLGSAAENYDVTISSEGTYIAEAESLLDQSGISLRSDQTSLTESWSNDLGSGTCLKGFTSDSVINITVKLDYKATITMYFMMSYYDSETFDFTNTVITFGGQTFSATAAGTFGHQSASDYWRWQTVNITPSITLEAGTYTFSICFGAQGMNLDYFAFSAVATSEDTGDTGSGSETTSYDVTISTDMKSWSNYVVSDIYIDGVALKSAYIV